MYTYCHLAVLIAAAAASTGAFATALEPLQRRATVDVCVDLSLNILGISLDVCICINAIAQLIASNGLLQALANLLGTTAVTAAITAQINAAPGAQTCNYPDHAVPQCRSGNPCFFTCTDGFVPSPPGNNPTACVCPAPMIVSGGQCVQAPCPSGICTRSRLGRRSEQCPLGKTACGILGRGAKAWECVDTMNDLESCGGCTFSLTHGEAKGVDCSAIRGAADVSCVSGSCVVSRCSSGYAVSGDRSTCVAEDNFAAHYDSGNTPL